MQQQRGNMDTGILYAIGAILIGLLLPNFWSQMPWWLQTLSVLVIVILIMCWLGGAGTWSGMADNIQPDRENKDGRDDQGEQEQ